MRRRRPERTWRRCCTRAPARSRTRWRASTSTRPRARPGDGAWCIREQLSHLYGDDRDTFLAGIQRVLIEGVAELDVVAGITHYTADRREVAFPALVSAVCGQYRAIAELAGQMSEDEIATRVRVDLLADSPFGATPTIGEWLVAIADMHLPRHIAQIRETREALGA